MSESSDNAKVGTGIIEFLKNHYNPFINFSFLDEKFLKNHHKPFTNFSFLDEGEKVGLVRDLPCYDYLFKEWAYI